MSALNSLMPWANVAGYVVLGLFMFYLLRWQLKQAAAERKDLSDQAHEERKATLAAHREDLAADRKVYMEGAEARHAEIIALLRKQ